LPTGLGQKGSEFSTYDIALVGVMAALSNVLGYLAIPGPWNIKFSMTGVPILLVAFLKGPLLGAVTGLIGGIVQALQYGHLAYVVYTAIQGGVAGYMAKKLDVAKRAAPLFFFAGGFFLAWWVDLILSSGDFNELLSQLLAQSGRGYEISPQETLGLPLAALASGLIFAVVMLAIARKNLNETTFFTIAGCMGAIAYVPYDAFVLYLLQGYPWIPTWFVLAKDLVQDFVAAWIAASIATSRRVKKLVAEVEYASHKNL